MLYVVAIEYKIKLANIAFWKCETDTKNIFKHPWAYKEDAWLHEWQL